MEKQGQAINAIGKILKLLLKVSMYLLWGVSRVAEAILSETNRLLKRVLEEKK